jgi:hypothetical protein
MGLIMPVVMHREHDDQPLLYDWFVGTLFLDSRVVACEDGVY